MYSRFKIKLIALQELYEAGEISIIEYQQNINALKIEIETCRLRKEVFQIKNEISKIILQLSPEDLDFLQSNL
jgi:hypothetical protein